MVLKAGQSPHSSPSGRHVVRLLATLIVISLCTVCSAQPSHDYAQYGYPITEIFTIDDYQQHDQNWAVLQGRNGLIYIANGFGLMEYDRTSWRLYPTPNRTRIRGMVEWTDGLIYVGTNHDIGRYRPNASGELTYHSLIDDWQDEARRFGEVWSVAATADWIAFSASEQLLLHDGTQTIVVPDLKPGTRRIFAIGDRFVMHRSSDNDLIRITPGPVPLIEVLASDLPDDTFPMDIRGHEDGSLTLVTAVDGILKSAQGRTETLVEHGRLNPDAVVYSTHWADDGYLYLGTLKHGLFILDADLNILRNYQQQHDLGSNTILDIEADRQGNLWLSGVPAITRMLPPHLFSQHRTDDQSESISFVVDHQGSKIGAGHGLYFLRPDVNPLFPPSFRAVPSLINLQFWDAISLPDGLLMARNDGIVLMTFDENDNVSSQKTLIESSFAYEIRRVSGTDVFFAITQDGLYRLERLPDASWQSDKIDGIDRTARTLLIQNPRTLWVGSPESKLFRIDLDQQQQPSITRFENEPAFGSGDIVPFVTDGRFYIGASEGVFIHQMDQNPPFRRADDLPSGLSQPHDHQFRALTDSSGRLWYQNRDQIEVAEQIDGQWQTRDKLFHGLDDQELMSIHEVSPDLIWAMDQEGGVITLNLSDSLHASSNAELKIRQIAALNDDSVFYRGTGPIEIPELTQQNNSLRIEYALPDYLSPAGSQYRVRLLGSDSDQWSDWSHEARKDYTLLRGGQYRFEVQARSRYGELSDVQAVEWSVEPHWALSRLAIACYVLVSLMALTLAGVAGSKWRKRKNLVYQAELKRQVTEQTRELARANERLRTLANSDGLTGLANRRLLDQKLEQAAGTGTHVALIMIDVDHFKQYNDHNGHLAGDDLLKSLADILSDIALPEAGLAARFGGEEFALLIPDTDGASAMIEAQQLHLAINARLPITVSMGIAHATLTRKEDISDLIERADSALYRAKESGRNTIRILQTVP